MNICGFQKMTLLDFPEHVACTVFLGGCNYRCPYCHNYELTDSSAPPVMEEEELIAFLKKRKNLLDGVAITGGEPCLQPALPRFLERIRDLGYAVKLDTNGTRPQMLHQLLQKNLVSYVAMDIKNTPEKYSITVGLPSVDLVPIQESIQLLMQNAPDYEFRTTVVDELHEPEDFQAIAEWIHGARRYFLQQFTDRDSVPYGNLHAPSREKMQDCLTAAADHVKTIQLRGID